MNAAEDILESIAELVAAKVLAKLGVTQRTVYTTSKLGPWVPGKSRAWMMREVKSIPGARKVGKDWLLSAEDLDKWAASKDRAKLSRKVPSPTSDEAIADRLLARGGFRATKGAH